MIEVVVSGAAGRLGRRIVARAAVAEGLTVTGGLVRPGSPVDGQPIPELADGAVYTSAASIIDSATVLIEVATRGVAVAHAEQAAEAGVPVVVATTGFDASEKARLRACGDRIPVLLAPNLSMGIAVLTDLVQRAARALGGYDVEILELHHNKKRDAPSGTAWALGAAAAQTRGQDIERDAICARAGETGPRGRTEIGMQAIRGGDIVGEHTVFLAGPTERLELTHRAASRDAFADGAVHAARFMGAPDRRAGVYTMRHVLGLDPQPS